MKLASEVKLLVRHSLIYGFGRVLDRSIGFIMLPVYTRYLTTHDYGVLEIVFLTLTYVGMVIDVGVTDSISRFYFGVTSAEDRNRVVSTAYLGIGTLTLAICLLLVTLSGPAAHHLLDGAGQKSLFELAFVGLFFDILVSIGFTYLRIRKQSFLLTVVSTGKLFISLGLNIYFVVFAGAGVKGVILSTLISNAVFGLGLAAFVLSRTGLGFSRGTFFQIFRFGLPLVPSNLATNLVRSSDRYFIKALVSISEAGLYGLGYKFGMLIHQFITTPFLQIWNPRRLELMSERDSPRIYAVVYTYFSFVLCFAGLYVAVFSEYAIRWMTPESFWAATGVVPALVLGHVAISLYYHFYMPILVAKRTRYFVYINIATAVVALLLNYVLIRNFGMMGAAISTILSYLVRGVLAFAFARRIGVVEFEFGRFSLLVAAAVSLYFLAVWFESERLPLELVARFLICLLFPLVLHIFGFFGRDEIRGIAANLTRSAPIEP